MGEKILYRDIKNKSQLRKRVVGDVLSVGCYWGRIKSFVKKEPFPGCKKIKVIYSPGYGGTAEVTRYI